MTAKKNALFQCRAVLDRSRSIVE